MRTTPFVDRGGVGVPGCVCIQGVGPGGGVCPGGGGMSGGCVQEGVHGVCVQGSVHGGVHISRTQRHTFPEAQRHISPNPDSKADTTPVDRQTPVNALLPCPKLPLREVITSGLNVI